MVDLKTDGGESLVQSNLSKPLAEVVDIYHKCNLGETLTQDQFNKLLQASINNTFPENYRIRMATCFVEHAHKFPDSIGDTIQTLLALICEQNSRHTRDTAVRSIPWLCRTIEEETRSRVICELSDVLLQLCMSSSGESLEQTASKALNELLVLDSKAVISKLFVWIGDNRVDEIDPEVCLQEKSFASQKLKEILTSKSECLSPESIQELGDILKEQIRMCSCIDDIHSVFKIVRSMKKFDDRQCARVLTAFLGEGLTPETATTSSLQEQRIPSLHIGATLVLCAPSAAKRIDSQLASKFIQNVFTLKFRRNLVLLQCAATMSEIASDECVAAILPSTIDALVEVLQNDTLRGLPKNLSELEALLSIFSQCARKVPTLLLKLIEQKNVEGTSTNKLFQSLASLKISLNQVITDELMYASKKFALTNEDDTTGMNQAPICISSILSYVNALTNSPMPKIPNPLPALSWESHFHTRKETSVPNKKNRQ